MKDFETIWREYEQELSAYVLSRVREVEVQKEVMQEVALKIFTSLHLQREHLRGWLYTLTKNAIVDYYRKHAKPPLEIEVETELKAHILSECLRPMLNSLKSQEKEMLELTQLQEYSLKEVATQKSIPLNTAKSQLFRAKKALASAFFTCCAYERNERGEIVDFDGCGC